MKKAAANATPAASASARLQVKQKKSYPELEGYDFLINEKVLTNKRNYCYIYLHLDYFKIDPNFFVYLLAVEIGLFKIVMIESHYEPSKF